MITWLAENNTERSGGVNDGRHAWGLVRSATTTGQQRMTYNLEVKDDNSYIADGIVVHNCQPFSAAGKQKGRDDARHLAPKFISLVGAARPGMLFGEQVASAEVFGKAAKRARGNFVAPPQWAWLDDLSDRLEAARYAVGASDFPSAGVGAPHIRQRTFFGAVSHEWLADAERWAAERHGQPLAAAPGGMQGAARKQRLRADAGDGIDTGGLVHGIGAGLGGHGGHGDGSREPGRLDQDATGSVAAAGPDGGMAQFGAAGPWKSYADWFGVCWHPECRDSDRGWCDCNTRGAPDGWRWDDHDGWVADSDGEGRLPGAQRGIHRGEESAGPRHGKPERSGDAGSQSATSPLHGFWADADWLFCRDGKWRPVEPGLKPLAHGVSGRVGLLRGYGNAINPHAAAEFIRAFDESLRFPAVERNDRVAAGGLTEMLS